MSNRSAHSKFQAIELLKAIAALRDAVHLLLPDVLTITLLHRVARRIARNAGVSDGIYTGVMNDHEIRAHHENPGRIR